MARGVHVRVELPPFASLIDAHGRDLHRFLTASVGPVDADDVYQDTWVAALAAYPRLAHAENLRGWVFTIAHRKALDRLRARSRVGVAVGTDQPDPGADVPATLREPGLWAAVGRLPPKQRTAVALRFLVDADYSRIAAMMEISEAAARRNVHEALNRLRREDLDVR